MKQVDYDERIVDLAATEVMHDAFMTYAEHVTLERALPRVEDGLKPVQRRILYTLHELGITPDKPYKKCARVVGEALGKYHPAGDSSVYEAMARMAQDFTMRVPLVDGHGNFGSVDGDGPAAMRYTEARMAALTLEMLRDLDKDTVPFRPNYDDTDTEPELLPARFPNLLVNGSSGIAVGLATNIPPHNPGEVLDAVLLRLASPHCTLDDVMAVLPGPDFPTGGLLLPQTGLRTAYETGRGKVQVRARTHIEKAKNGRSLIVITEVPYEVKKSALLEKIQQVSETKRDLFAGIEEVRDESDREGMRGVVEVRKGSDPEMILQLLYRHTDLQCTFGINMMAIAQGSPRQLGLLDILDAYIGHQKNVVLRRTRFELERAEKREHILSGLIVAVENIDEVIRIIRGASSTDAAKKSLMSRFSLTGVQAQAILDMRLARLNQLEVKNLRAEHEAVLKEITRLRSILDSDQELVRLIRQELRAVRKKFADHRRTEILPEETGEIRIDESELLPSEECVLLQTRGGGFKRMLSKGFQRALENLPELEEKLRVRRVLATNTQSRVLLFSSLGRVYTLPALQIPEGRLRDPGKLLSHLVPGVARDEQILFAADYSQLTEDRTLFFVTAHGFVKAVAASQFAGKKTKLMTASLKDGDELIAVFESGPEEDVLFITSDGFGLRIAKEEIPQVGRAALGVHGIRLGTEARVLFAAGIPRRDQSVLICTSGGYMRQFDPELFRRQPRNRRGTRLVGLGGPAGEHLAGALSLDRISTISIACRDGSVHKLSSADIPLATRTMPDTEPVPVLPPGLQADELYSNAAE